MSTTKPSFKFYHYDPNEIQPGMIVETPKGNPAQVILIYQWTFGPRGEFEQIDALLQARDGRKGWYAATWLKPWKPGKLDRDGHCPVPMRREHRRR